MKRVLLTRAALFAVVAVLAAGCGNDGRNGDDVDAPGRGCLTDADCQDEQVCEKGVCALPPSHPEVGCTWRAVSPMQQARLGHSTTPVDGGVFVTGGQSSKGGGVRYSTTETYHASNDTWTPGPTMSVGRSYQSSIRLADGRVMLIGGTQDPAPAELYDPETATLETSGEPLAPFRPELALLDDGRMVAVGGTSEGIVAPMFDPTTDTWSTLPEPPVPLIWPRVISDGTRVAVFAHATGPEDPELGGITPRPRAFWLDPDGTWTAMPEGGCYGVGQFALPLSDRRVFLFGGSDLDQESGCTSIVDLATQVWTGSEPMYVSEYDFLNVRPGFGVLYSSGLQFVHPDTGPPEYVEMPIAAPTLASLSRGALIAVGGFKGDGIAINDAFVCD